jgi:MoxR-like ATPase
MTKYTQTDELFGPVSFSGIKNETYQRVTAQTLVEAELAILDETWKPSSAILNTLLKLVNEREFQNGVTKIKVPLMSLFGASNELPEGHDLDAIRDRFLFTSVVNYLSATNFDKLMARKAGLEPDPFTFPKTVIGRDDLLLLQAYAPTLPFNRQAHEGFCAVREELKAVDIHISERRAGFCQDAMRAHAVLENRDQVTTADITILVDALTLEDGQRPTVLKIVNKYGDQTNAKAAELKDKADEIYNKTKKLIDQAAAGQADRQRVISAAAVAAAELESYLTELNAMQGVLTKPSRKVAQTITSVEAQHAEMLKAVGFRFNM